MAVEVTGIEKYLGLMSDPGIRRQVAEAQAKADADARLNARREIVKLKNVDIEAAIKMLPAMAETVADAKARAEVARKAYMEAVDEFRNASGALLSATNKFDRQRERFDAQLRETGDPHGRIARFIQDLDTEWELTRRLPSRSELRATGEFYCVTGKPVTTAWSDHLSRARLLVAIRQAQASAEMLKLEALSDKQIESRLRAIAEALPGVQMENVSLATAA